MKQVEEFTREKGFEDKLELFQKAALLAQNPKDFENISDLTESDKEIIRRETTRKLLICFIYVCPANTPPRQMEPTPRIVYDGRRM